MKKQWIVTLISFPMLLLVGLLIKVFFSFNDQTDKEIAETNPKKYYELEQNKENFHFNLVDPEEAPEEIRTEVMLGFRILNQTQEYAKEYAGNSITCNNCHFNAGNSLGGKNNGISLVGVTTIYPHFSKRENRVISLEERISNCFQRSLDGNPMPSDAPEMRAIIAYLKWISSEVDHLKEFPWLGLKMIKNLKTGDIERGKNVYSQHCAVCHMEDGSGATGVYPALWGNDSFNDGAGMNTFPVLSAFVLWNMPRMQPILSEQEAIDVATYIIHQPRPKFIKNN